MSENSQEKKRTRHTFSKYETMYENSIISARKQNKTSPKKSKRKLTEYNKFIKENSSKFTGPDRLKQISKLWKKVKADKSKNKEESKIIFTTTKSRKIKQNVVNKKSPKSPKSPKPTKSSKSTKSPKSPKPTKSSKSPKPTNKKNKPIIESDMIDATKASKQINKRNRQKSDNLLDNDTQNMKKSNKQGSVNNKTQIISENKPKRTAVQSKPKKLRFFNYIEK